MWCNTDSMSEPNLELADCVERTRQGDQDAARRVVELLHPQVRQIVRSHLPSRAAEEDLVQDVFVKIMTRLDQYRPQAQVPFTHWVSRLAVRTCLDALRSERRRPECRWTDLPEEQLRWLEYLAADTPAPHGEAASARELVTLLLRQLPPEDRLVLTWLDLEEQSVRAISERTGWTQTWVKVRAFRARRRLRSLAEQFRKEIQHEPL